MHRSFLSSAHKGVPKESRATGNRSALGKRKKAKRGRKAREKREAHVGIILLLIVQAIQPHTELSYRSFLCCVSNISILADSIFCCPSRSAAAGNTCPRHPTTHTHIYFVPRNISSESPPRRCQATILNSNRIRFRYIWVASDMSCGQTIGATTRYVPKSSEKTVSDKMIHGWRRIVISPRSNKAPARDLPPVLLAYLVLVSVLSSKLCVLFYLFLFVVDMHPYLVLGE